MQPCKRMGVATVFVSSDSCRNRDGVACCGCLYLVGDSTNRHLSVAGRAAQGTASSDAAGAFSALVADAKAVRRHSPSAPLAPPCTQLRAHAPRHIMRLRTPNHVCSPSLRVCSPTATQPRSKVTEHWFVRTIVCVAWQLLPTSTRGSRCTGLKRDTLHRGLAASWAAVVLPAG